MLSDILSLYSSSFFTRTSRVAISRGLPAPGRFVLPARSVTRDTLRVTSILVSSHFTEYKYVCTVYNLDFDETSHLSGAAAGSISELEGVQLRQIQRGRFDEPGKPASSRTDQRTVSASILRESSLGLPACLLAGAAWHSKHLTAQQLAMHDRFSAFQSTPCSACCANNIS